MTVGLALSADREAGERSEADRPGSEMSAIIVGRRWVLVGVTLVSAAGFLLAVAPLAFASPLGKVAVLALVALIAVGIAQSDRAVGLWLLVAAESLVALAGPLSSEPSTRSDPSVAIFLATYFAITLLPRAAGFGVVAASVALMSSLGLGDMPVLAVGDWVVSATAVRMLQMAISAGWLAALWPGVLGDARLRDQSRAERERELAESLRTQERVRVWRDTAIRVHETTLNDIRYVLDAGTLDRGRLMSELRSRPLVGPLPQGEGRFTLADVVSEAVADSGFAGTLTVEVPEVQVKAEAVPYLRASLVESLRNLERHADATQVRIRSAVSGAGTTISIDADAPAAMGDAPAGIGRAIVLEESIRSIGGDIGIAGSQVTIRLPVRQERADEPDGLPGRPGRIVVSAVLAGAAVGAFPYPLALLGSGSAGLTVAGAAALVLLAAGVLAAVRRRRVPIPVVVACALLAAAVPLALGLAQGPCLDGVSLVYVIGIVGDALIAVAVWVQWRRLGWFVAPWALAALAFVLLNPQIACGRVPVNALTANVLAALSLTVVAALSLSRSLRREMQARAVHAEGIQQAARAEAARDLARELDVAVAGARAVMVEVADGAELDPERRRLLRCHEARIRATIQVDPQSGGAFTQAARQIVSQLADEGCGLEVLSLRDSGDARPIPDTLSELVRDLARDSVESGCSIHVVTYGDEDHLAVTASTDAVLRAGRSVPSRTEVGDASLEIEGESTPGGAVLVVLRRQTAADRQASSPSS